MQTKKKSSFPLVPLCPCPPTRLIFFDDHELALPRTRLSEAHCSLPLFTKITAVALKRQILVKKGNTEGSVVVTYL